MIWIGFAPVALREAAAPGAVMEALNLQGSAWFGPALGLDEDQATGSAHAVTITRGQWVR